MSMVDEVGEVRKSVAQKWADKGWLTKVEVSISGAQYWSDVDDVIEALTLARDRLVAAGAADIKLDIEVNHDERYGTDLLPSVRGWRKATPAEIRYAKNVEGTAERERIRHLREELARLEAQTARVTSDLDEEGSP